MCRYNALLLPKQRNYKFVAFFSTFKDCMWSIVCLIAFAFGFVYVYLATFLSFYLSTIIAFVLRNTTVCCLSFYRLYHLFSSSLHFIQEMYQKITKSNTSLACVAAQFLFIQILHVLILSPPLLSVNMTE